MKNLKSCLFLIALVSLICVFIPGRALAQDDGTDPCCHVPPGIAAGIIQSDVQPLINANDVALDVQANQTETPLFNQSVLATIGKATEMPVAAEESWTHNYRR